MRFGFVNVLIFPQLIVLSVFSAVLLFSQFPGPELLREFRSLLSVVSVVYYVCLSGRRALSNTLIAFKRSVFRD